MILSVMSSRCVAVFLVCVFAVLSPWSSRADDYPAKTVRMLVPYAAGGQADIVARLIGQELSNTLGQAFVVENRPGAGGTIAVEALLKAPADGYTLLVADAGQWAINPALQPQPYDARKDLSPIAKVTTSSLFLVAHHSVPAQDLSELVALAKQKPGTLTYGSSGNGTVHHLSMETFKAALGLDIVHVPYRGTSQSVPALAGGHTSLAIAGYSAIAPFLQGGQIRLLGANTRARSRLAPETPSMADAGVPDFDFPAEVAFFAPSGTPKPIIDKLAAAIRKVSENSELHPRFFAAGVEPSYASPEQLQEVVKADIEKYTRSVRISNAKGN